MRPCRHISFEVVREKPLYGVYKRTNSSVAAGMSSGCERRCCWSSWSFERWLQIAPMIRGGATIPTTKLCRRAPLFKIRH